MLSLLLGDTQEAALLFQKLQLDSTSVLILSGAFFFDINNHLIIHSQPDKEKNNRITSRQNLLSS